ncbi:hypothetical protein BH10CHL1_BH10CHL1_42800 [soil metagenome]
MPPIIRRTITITVTETWTITWPDGQETVWHTTHVTAEPASRAPEQPRLARIEKVDEDGLELDAADLSVDDL